MKKIKCKRIFKIYFFENEVLVQERIIKHLTKKLGLTKLDLERIQHEAIAKVIKSSNVKKTKFY